jgi:hypothetical protein
MRRVIQTIDLDEFKPSLVGVALDRANFVRADVVVAGGLNIAGTAAIADGGAIRRYESVRISSSKLHREHLPPEAAAVAIGDADRLDILVHGTAVQRVCTQPMN